MPSVRAVWRLAWAVFILLSCAAAAPSPPPAGQDGCKQVDPVCMAKLNLNTKAGFLKTPDEITAAVFACLGVDSSDVGGPAAEAHTNTWYANGRTSSDHAPHTVVVRVTHILLGDWSTVGWDQVDYIQSQVLPMVKSMSGIVTTADMVPPSQIPSRVLDLAQTGRSYYAMIAAAPYLAVDLAAQDRITVLDKYVVNDPSLEWMDVHKFIRSQTLYNGSITSLPMTGTAVLLYYRRDYLSAAKLPVPATWDDLVMVAQALNGTDYNNDGKPDYAMCLMIAGEYCDGRDASWIIETILASYTQVRGLSSGWMFDPDTITSFADTEAMRKTLEILAKLVALSWPSSACTNMSPDFWAGRCAITVSHDGTFKDAQAKRAPNPLKGKSKMGMLLPPGSHEVFNRATGKLTECTSTSQCPYATPQYSLALNRTVLVNNAPVNVPVASIFLNRDVPAGFLPLASQIMSIMSSPSTSTWILFSTQGMGSPFRYKQLAMTPAALATWANYGCNITDVKEYLTVINAILDHPNIATDFRVLNGYIFRDYLQQAAFMVANNTPVDITQTWLAQQFTATLEKIPKRQFAETMWLGLNLQRTWQDPSPPPGTPSSTPTVTPVSSDSTNTIATATILAVAVPIGIVALLLAVAGAWAVKRGWVKLGPSGPPKAGPQSTLVVTDVEDSTVLWETLPMGAMDQAIRLHHTLIRKLMATYHGYESATEGDSFIMAFHTAGDALRFCFSLQKQLMEQPWPQEILDHKPTAPVRVMEKVMIATPQEVPLRVASHTQGSQTGNEEGSTSRPTTEQGAARHQVTFRDTTTATSDNSPRFRLSAVELQGREALTTLRCLQRRWMTVPKDVDVTDAAEAMVLAYRGIRLRLGLHSGLTDQEIVLNKTNGGIQYTGHALTVAKAVADSGQGGMVLMTLAAFEAIKHELSGMKKRPAQAKPKADAKVAPGTDTSDDNPDVPLILHIGCYSFGKAPDLPPCELYMALCEGLDCRLAVGRTELRNTAQLASGVLQAPVGQASVVFCTMVGYQTLLSWNKDLALGALAMYNDTATRLLASTGGEGHYLLEMADGLCLCVFSSAASAILWGLRVVETMKQLDWAEELLAHELCESVAVSVAADMEDEDDEDEKEVAMLFRGPRVKVGVDFGDVTCDVSPATARLAYRGRPMNRAARVMDKVPSGQVWCTEAAWEHVDPSQTSGAVKAKEVGLFPMKGLSQALRLYSCSYTAGWHDRLECTSQGSARLVRTRSTSSPMGLPRSHTTAVSTARPSLDSQSSSILLQRGTPAVPNRRRASLFMLVANHSTELNSLAVEYGGVLNVRTSGGTRWSGTRRSSAQADSILDTQDVPRSSAGRSITQVHNVAELDFDRRSSARRSSAHTHSVIAPDTIALEE